MGDLRKKISIILVGICIVIIGVSLNKISNQKEYIELVSYNNLVNLCDSLDMITDTDLNLDQDTKRKLLEIANKSIVGLYNSIDELEKSNISINIADLDEVEDMEVLLEINTLVNKLTVSTISQGNSIGISMEKEGSEAQKTLLDISKLINESVKSKYALEYISDIDREILLDMYGEIKEDYEHGK